MILLRANTDDLRVTTGTTGSDIEIHISAMVADSASPPALKGIPDIGPFASIVTNVTNQVLIDSSTISGIASGDSVNIEDISAYNNHATVATTVEFNVTDATVTTVLAKVNLLAGEMLKLTQSGVWLHYDANGALYPSVGNKATQTEMEAGTADDRYVTPLSFNWHPGAAKFWCKAGVAGTASVSWNLTSIGDTGTGVMTPTIATDFSSANWCAQVTIENLDASIDATTDKQTAMIGLAGQAAGTLQCICGNETGTAAADPTQWHVVGYGDQ